MAPDPLGPNVIDIDGIAMLLTTAGGGAAVHLTTGVAAPDAGRQAVPDSYFPDGVDRAGIPAGSDRAALIAPRWSATTLCNREWVVMVGGDSGAIGRWGEVAYAPTCRRCLAVVVRSR